MFKLVGIIINILIVDFYYFPFSFSVLPSFNLKMGLALIGILISIFSLTHGKNHLFPKEVLMILLLASFVSLFSLLTMVINKTDDSSYVNYISSAAVWLSGALTVCTSIKLTHGEISVKLLCMYLLAVCALQSISAQIIDRNDALADFICQNFDGYHSGMRGARLYSLGCAVDFAGCRFAAVNAATLTAMVAAPEDYLKGEVFFTWITVIIITVLGSMIARTTFVGTGIGLCFVLYAFLKSSKKSFTVIWPVLVLLVASIPVFVYLYNTDSRFHSLMRFGFEGFFSLFETGHWHTTSNDLLADMVKWPENLKTWLIGDGYFYNAKTMDVNYLGPDYYGGYYMGTDIGYCRFIFYIGLIGLFSMMGMVLYPTKICCKKSPKYTLVFLAILVCALAVWAKVASDLFFICALFFCTALMNPERRENEDLT